jgi:hypothetical protein
MASGSQSARRRRDACRSRGKGKSRNRLFAASRRRMAGRARQAEVGEDPEGRSRSRVPSLSGRVAMLVDETVAAHPSLADRVVLLRDIVLQ